MGFICDFCGDQRAMVYCRSDAACLCLSCDHNVHSANALSRRHSRTLLCERCNSEPALVRCTEESISLCQNCDWLGHGTSTVTPLHKRHTINSYSGCPSSRELSSIWSFISDLPDVGNACEQGLGYMSITENCVRDASDAANIGTCEKLSSPAEANDICAVNKSIACVESSSIIELCSASYVLDLPPGSATATLSKACSPGTKGPRIANFGDLHEGFYKDEVDLDLENYEEIFDVALNHSEELFKNVGIDDLLRMMDMSADSSCQDAIAAEVLGSSLGLVNAVQAAASADSVMSSKTEPLLCYNTRQAHSGLSFSGVAGESSGGDYQDCGASPMVLMGEPPWFLSAPETSSHSADRTHAVMRYKEKKKARKFDQKVRYASRKARADSRKRVKGRFVKAGEAYDYYPLSQSTSC